MSTREERRLERILREFESSDTDEDYLELYDSYGEEKQAFATLHKHLNHQLDFLNYKALNGASGHFNANNSRELIDINRKVSMLSEALKQVGKSLILSPEYQRVMDSSASWLEPSGGSAIPQGLTPIAVDNYGPIFSFDDTHTTINTQERIDLKVIGEGAYATVYKFKVPRFGVLLAKKKLKPEAVLDKRERDRFEQEFTLMKQINFPYILKVYKFEPDEHAYYMEYCDTNLNKYIARNNNKSDFTLAIRKRIAEQFILGISHIHKQGHCHRDISTNNVLIQKHDGQAVTVKLSDFGLAKQADSNYTQTHTQMKGTQIDPALEHFKDFTPVNDIYSIGHVLNYIFTGRTYLKQEDTPINRIVTKCVENNPSNRYQTAPEILSDIRRLIKPTASRRQQIPRRIR